MYISALCKCGADENIFCTNTFMIIYLMTLMINYTPLHDYNSWTQCYIPPVGCLVFMNFALNCFQVFARYLHYLDSNAMRSVGARKKLLCGSSLLYLYSIFNVWIISPRVDCFLRLCCCRLVCFYNATYII